MVRSKTLRVTQASCWRSLTQDAWATRRMPHSAHFRGKHDVAPGSIQAEEVRPQRTADDPALRGSGPGVAGGLRGGPASLFTNAGRRGLPGTMYASQPGSRGSALEVSSVR